MKHRQQAGFALIELIMVTTIIALASIPILGQFTQVANSTLIDEEIQTASQLAQERAEEILAFRRDQGYAAVALGTATEAFTGNYAKFSRIVNVSEPTTIGGCATGASCKSVVVVVRYGPRKRAEIAYVLTDY